MQKIWVGNTVFAKELPDSSELSVVIGEIGSHRCHQLIIGYRRWHRCETRYFAAHRIKVSIGYPRTSASEKRPESNCIVIGCGRSTSVPGFRLR
jgi:hypothetical protein